MLDGNRADVWLCVVAVRLLSLREFRPNAAAYGVRSRAAPLTVEVTPKDQPRKRPLECKQLVVKGCEAQFPGGGGMAL
jgi:hypothetical protein